MQIIPYYINKGNDGRYTSNQKVDRTLLSQVGSLVILRDEYDQDGLNVLSLSALVIVESFSAPLRRKSFKKPLVVSEPRTLSEGPGRWPFGMLCQGRKGHFVPLSAGG